MKGLLIARGVMLVLLLGFITFWYLPSMLSQQSWRRSMDNVFNDGESCWVREYDAKNWEASVHCHDKFYAWVEKNKVPEPGIDWPWHVWKEAGSEGGK